MGHNGTGVTKDVYINLPEEIYDCEKVIGNFIIDILPQTDFVFDIQISEKDLLDRKSTRLNSSHSRASRMPSSA